MPVNLLIEPRSRSEQLGLPMPDDQHAVSACLPLWEHNIGYEEGDEAVHAKLQAAYPRFCLHPLVSEVCRKSLHSDSLRGLPFISAQAAQRACEYVKNAGVSGVQLRPFDGQSAVGVQVPHDSLPLLRQYWQHAGENVSSRVAELILREAAAAISETRERQTIRERVAVINDVTPEDVFLYPSGMAAVAAAWRTVTTALHRFTCQFGFPYVDTLKIQQRFPGAEHLFFPVGSDLDLDELSRQCDSRPPAAVFCEVPTNPLLMTPNLARLRRLADEYNFLVVVDDTLAACGNVDVMPYADLVVTSLTKYFSGYGNVLAGSLVLNPRGAHYGGLREQLAAEFEETLADVDAAVLCRNSDDVSQRTHAINHNAEQLADWLRTHDAVESVYYPKGDPAYEAIRKTNAGYGGLLSIVLKDAASQTPGVFDSLRVCKGPNLGTHFTLCCPYTILAHYDELDDVETHGVSRWLLRISVGCEPVEELITRFEDALVIASE